MEKLRGPRVSPAPMADADALVHSPPPAWRNIAASLARRCHALAVAAVYLFLAIMWLLFASFGALYVGCGARGEGCPMVAAAHHIIHAASISLVILTVTSGAAASFSTAFKTRAGTTEKKVPASKDVAPAERQVLCALFLGMIASVVFFFLTFVGSMLKAVSVKETHRVRIGAWMMDIGVLGGVAFYCLVILPALALFVWKVMLVMQRGSTSEAKPAYKRRMCCEDGQGAGAMLTRSLLMNIVDPCRRF